jgi:hypothetical protein
VDKSVLTIQGSNSSYESFYTWETDPVRMTHRTTDAGEYDYAYYFDKVTQEGDFLNFEKILSMYDKYYLPFSSSHLLKSIKRDNDPLVDVTYTFDNDNRITSFLVSYDGNPDTEKWDVTYECK